MTMTRMALTNTITTQNKEQNNVSWEVIHVLQFVPT